MGQGTPGSIRVGKGCLEFLDTCRHDLDPLCQLLRMSRENSDEIWSASKTWMKSDCTSTHLLPFVAAKVPETDSSCQRRAIDPHNGVSHTIWTNCSTTTSYTGLTRKGPVDTLQTVSLLLAPLTPARIALRIGSLLLAYTGWYTPVTFQFRSTYKYEESAQRKAQDKKRPGRVEVGKYGESEGESENN